jgi:hypothetical protein
MHAVAAKVPGPSLEKESPYKARMAHPLLCTSTSGRPVCEIPLPHEASTSLPPLTLPTGSDISRSIRPSLFHAGAG